ncbi:amino acid/amide ABC transporter ATP-binding protein 1, HAAT family [Tistlia consotensis]|uniref:Amino acid/amide ABC transporter ATP-binding protein 1, HAAT family n=1 Tax=Tistlia consotensis USBA 355 TaxID=560819 RepID=A0A1Y6B661_9PROT|nr:ABC transporter ATP-binding protein [Tistlia consotensis]SME92154.1 amino acid/amide ABC transporter ATP-binding protein 1, HAAT family [Tistlia consotensis USBA 355]SNR27862.1 amino acid/amide ABC transporter ATP-binding protein 1, HAAT family [Tistlia consotensis]
MITEPPVLSTEALTIRFGGHVAVDRVSCAFERGTLTAIVGPNGAGKTTYFNLISGQLRSSAGRVLLFGRDVTGLGAPRRARAGIGRAFQLTNLFPDLTVLENVRIAVQARHASGFDLWSLATRRRELIELAEHHLSRTGLLDRLDATAASLSHGDQRKLEVAVLLALESEVLMFDEPTAGMSVDEVPLVLDLIQEIKADRSKTILLVEHKMDVVRSLADRIIVLHNGALVAEGAPEAVIASDIVQQAYLGTAGSGAGAGHG